MIIVTGFALVPGFPNTYAFSGWTAKSPTVPLRIDTCSSTFRRRLPRVRRPRSHRDCASITRRQPVFPGDITPFRVTVRIIAPGGQPVNARQKVVRENRAEPARSVSNRLRLQHSRQVRYPRIDPPVRTGSSKRPIFFATIELPPWLNDIGTTSMSCLCLSKPPSAASASGGSIRGPPAYIGQLVGDVGPGGLDANRTSIPDSSKMAIRFRKDTSETLSTSAGPTRDRLASSAPLQPR